MVVDHAGGLHEGVANCRADEAEAALLQIFAYGVRFLCFRWNLLVEFPGVLDGFAFHESPEIKIETSELFLHSQESARICNRGIDFKAIAANARVFQEHTNFLGIVAGYFVDQEIVENFAVASAFGENGVPAEAGLRAFKNEKFEEETVIVDGDAPFLIVIGNIDWFLRPGAPGEICV